MKEDNMTTENSEKQFRHGKSLLKEGDMDRALRAFEKAHKEDRDNPMYMSYYGMCTALRGGEMGLGLELCTRAIKKEFHRVEYYINLGKVYMAVGNKKGALKVFKTGLRFDPNNEELNKFLVELGFRRPPIVPVLKRSNPVNKYLGILLRRTLPKIMKKKQDG